ncbi:protein Ast2p [[Candida] anglica]|uniref:Protein Ast2p n=1 Tax=[Candida] anglica TaxID=148631 RepID=A0ABP0EIN6_9ASCO
MTFDKQELEFNALQYANNRSPMKIEKDAFQLTPIDGGKEYSVNSNEILIKVHSAALNPVDIVLYNSAHPLISYMKGGALQGTGRDYSGTVVAVGDSVTKKLDFNVGDKVCGMYTHPFGKGTVSEYIRLDPFVDSAITNVPENVSLEVACSWPLVYGTAQIMVETAKVETFSESSRVLVIGGATSVGRYVVQLCKNVYNVKDVVAICSASSAETVKSLGANSIIDYKVHPNIFNPVSEYAAEKGKFDAIFDCCGNGDLFQDLPSLLQSNSSSYLTIQGNKKGDYTVASMSHYMKSNLSMFPRIFMNALGLLGYNYAFVMTKPGKWIHDGKKNIELGKVKIQVDSVYKMNDFEEAFTKLRSNRASGKIIISVE